jgi:hypothetical protein
MKYTIDNHKHDYNNNVLPHSLDDVCNLCGLLRTTIELNVITTEKPPQEVDKGSIDGRLKQEKVQDTVQDRVQDESERFIGKIKREWYMKGYKEAKKCECPKCVKKHSIACRMHGFHDSDCKG